MITQQFLKLSTAFILLYPTLGWCNDDRQWQANLALDARQFNYREFSDSGANLNHEQGIIPGVQLEITRLFASNWDAKGTFAYHHGEVDYTGQTQAGIPISSTTDESLYAGSLQLGYTNKHSIRWYAELGARHWQRNIASSPIARGLDETYRWHYLGVGVALPIIRTTSTSIALDVKTTAIQQANILISSHGLYDDKQLRLGNKLGYHVAIPISFRHNASLQWTITPYWENFAFGKSDTEPLYRNGVIIGNIHEPKSKTEQLGLTIGIKRSF